MQETKESFIEKMVSDWIADTKYALSGRLPQPRLLFCPVTVPNAVDHRLIMAAQKRTEEYPGMFTDHDFIYGQLRLDLVWRYLSHPGEEHLVWRHGLCTPELDVKSKEKTSRLEGELRRFGADIHGADPRDVAVVPALVSMYNLVGMLDPIEDKLMNACGFVWHSPRYYLRSELPSGCLTPG